MSIAAIISLCLTAGLFIISSLFKIAGKLRLGIPLIYLLIAVVSTFFTRWTTEHEQLVLMGLYIVIGLTALSWIVSLIKTIRRRRDEKYLEDDVAWQIQQAREMGIPLDKIQFNGQGDLLDPRTGEPVVYGQATSFKDM